MRSGGLPSQPIRARGSLEAFVGVVVVLVVAFSPLVNTLFSQSSGRLTLMAIGGIAGLIVILGRNFTTAGKCFCFIAAVISFGEVVRDHAGRELTLQLLKLLSVPMAVLATTAIARDQAKAYRRTLSVLLSVHVCIALLQLLGVS